MRIGIDASRAFLKCRTGIEEYSYQTIKHLRSVISETDTVILYVRKEIGIKNGKIHITIPHIDFDLPNNWRVKALFAPRFWTQIRLSLEMFLFPPDVLFIPAHTVPFIHPKRTIVTIHGLEYEFCKESYALLERLYMRLSIRFSCSVACSVICVSENTKKDVMHFYDVEESKIHIIYEGYEEKYSTSSIEESGLDMKCAIRNTPYILFIGRLEERKNVVRIIEAFEILKETYRIPHELILVGKPGYGYEKIQKKKEESKERSLIRELGYVSEEEKWMLLKGAGIFLFPSLYEGFGIPILEAQSVSVPIVTSSISSLPEVGGKGAFYVNPYETMSIVRGIHTLLSNEEVKNGILEEAMKNVRFFRWDICADKIYRVMRML